MALARLTYMHWHDQRQGALLVNPFYVIAVTPMDDTERHRGRSQVTTANGNTYCVAETVDEVAGILSAADTARVVDTVSPHVKKN